MIVLHHRLLLMLHSEDVFLECGQLLLEFLLEWIEICHEIRWRWRLRHIQLWRTKEGCLSVKLIIGVVVVVIWLMLELILLKVVLRWLSIL